MKLWWWKNDWLYDCMIFLHINKCTLSFKIMSWQKIISQTFRAARMKTRNHFYGNATRRVTQEKIMPESQWKFTTIPVFSTRITIGFPSGLHWNSTGNLPGFNSNLSWGNPPEFQRHSTGIPEEYLQESWNLWKPAGFPLEIDWNPSGFPLESWRFPAESQIFQAEDFHWK